MNIKKINADLHANFRIESSLSLASIMTHDPAELGPQDIEVCYWLIEVT